jgi:hypothetical protein
MFSLSPGKVASLAVAIILGATGPVAAGSFTGSSAGTAFALDLMSIREAKFKRIVPQQYDFSCGSASIATLLTYHYEDPTNEKAVFEKMWALGDQEKIRSQGFSLLDMKRFLESRGYAADGYQAPLSKLAEVGIPAVVLINLRGYLHFVVVKGITGDAVLVGDPALGLKTYTRAEFEEMWNGILFVITSNAEIAQSGFNREEEWRLKPTGPLGVALSREAIAAVSLMLPTRNMY